MGRESVFISENQWLLLKRRGGVYFSLTRLWKYLYLLYNFWKNYDALGQFKFEK